jgi:glycosyltransferase involved in cell wall biosynthesis
VPDAPVRAVVAGHTWPQVGGLVHYTHSLANALARQPGCASSLLDLSGFAPRRFYTGGGRSADGGIPLDPRVQVRRGPGLAAVLGRGRTRRALRGADVAHLQLSDPAFSPAMRQVARAARREGVAVVATVHDLQPHRSWQRPMNAILAAVARGADRVLVHEESLADACAERFGLDRGRVGVVPHAVYDAFGADRLTRAQARRRLGLPDDRTILLAFGSVLPYKGTEVAVEALAHLPDSVHLLVAGPDKGMWPAVRRRIDELGLAGRVHDHVRLLDDAEIGAYLRAADAAVLPYRDFHSQSGAAMAAVGAGLPLVVSDVPSLRGLAPSRMRARPGDPASLAAAVRSWLADPTGPPPAPTWDDVARLTVAEYRLALGARR